MKLNWVEGIFRVILILFFFAAAGYEVITQERVHKFMTSWNNGLEFGLKLIIIPVVSISLCVWAVNWCRKGFKEPKLNWVEGVNRFAVAFATSMLVIGSCAFFIWRLESTKDLVGSIVLTVIVIVPVVIICGVVDWAINWIDEGLNKSKDDAYDDE